MDTDPKDLGSVHFTRHRFRTFVSFLEDLVSNPEIELTVQSNGFDVTESSVDELFGHEMVQGDIFSYNLLITGEEGRIRVVANSRVADEHLLYVDGEDGWEDRTEGEIIDHLKDDENWWRSKIKENYIYGAEVFLAIAFARTLGVYVPGLVRPNPTLLKASAFFLSAVLLFAAVQRNRIYPYFVISKFKWAWWKKSTVLIFPAAFTLGAIIARHFQIL